MHAPPPTCPRCGALATNPGLAACQYCGAPLFGAAPSVQQAPYAQPAMPPQQQAPYGSPPANYGPGQAQPAYGGQAQPAYGQPPHHYGYGGAPYGGAPGAAPMHPMQGPPNAAYGGYHVQPMAVQPNPYAVRQTSGWQSFWAAMNVIRVIRLVIAVVVLSAIGVGACVNALSH